MGCLHVMCGRPAGQERLSVREVQVIGSDDPHASDHLPVLLTADLSSEDGEDAQRL